MTQCVQYFDQITAAAQMVTAGAVMNIISWCVLIWCAIKLRKAARQVQEAKRWLVEPHFNAGLANNAHQAKETDHAE